MRSFYAVTLFLLILGSLSAGYGALADTDLVATFSGRGSF
jgi:hypothetical protein